MPWKNETIKTNTVDFALGLWLIGGGSFINVLIVTTSCNMLAPDHPTGFWVEEYAVLFAAFSEAGALIRVASPKGGVVPIDPKTAPTEKDRDKWPEALEALTDSSRDPLRPKAAAQVPAAVMDRCS